MRNDRVATGAIAAPLCCAALLALAACRDATPPESAAPAPIAPAKTMTPPDLEGVTASYRCDQGHRIDIVRDLVARVALADGRVVRLETVQGSTPPTFMDNGLILSLVSDTVAKLDDRDGNTVSCTKIETAKPPAS
jgi:hypothetical protein